MNKLFLLLVFTAVTFSSNAQSNDANFDSLKYYKEELDTLNDEFKNSDNYIKLNDEIDRLSISTDNYQAAVLYSQISFANFDILNSDYRSMGFSPLSGFTWSAGYGGSFKKRRRIVEFSLGVGFPRKSTSPNENIKVSFSNFLQLEWGYDIIKSKMINIYPYGGLGLRFSTLEYNATKQLNPTPSNITNVVQNDKSTYASVFEVGYQTGIGLDVVLTSSLKKSGTIFFLKAGTNRAFKSNSYDFDGFTYNPHLEYGRLIITAGFKFFTR